MGVHKDNKGTDRTYWKLSGRGHGGQGKATDKLNSRESLLQLKQHRQPNKILQGHVPLPAGKHGGGRKHSGKEPGKGEGITDGWVLPRELLDNGQGKLTSSDMDISDSSEGEDQPPEVVHNNITNRKGIPQRLLLPPVIEATGLLATGATTEVL